LVWPPGLIAFAAIDIPFSDRWFTLSEGPTCVLPATFCNHTSQKRKPTMRPVAFGEALYAGTRLTLCSADKPDRFFTVIKFWMDKTSGVALALQTGVPSCQLEDEEGRTHLLIHVPIEEENEDRRCLWRPDHAGFDSRSIFEGAFVEE
jgi:hypothetical protein